MKLVVAYLVGLLFGLGISVSGMINPSKVVNFFDVAGVWDPSLAFVMGGALITTFFGYRVVLKKQKPVFAEAFGLPGRSELDRNLLIGAAVFGLGWGVAGFCPGAALPALGTGNTDVLVFVASLIAGIGLTKLLRTKVRDRLQVQS